MKHRKARYPIYRSGGIIFNKDLNKILLVLNKYSKDSGEYKWGLPKGHRDNGERISSCAQREIKEETGLSLPIDFFNNYIYIHNSCYYIIYLQQDYNNFKVEDSDEIAEVKWVDFKTLQSLSFNRDLKKFMDKNKSDNNFDFCESRIKRSVHYKETITTIINNRLITV